MKLEKLKIGDRVLCCKSVWMTEDIMLEGDVVKLAGNTAALVRVHGKLLGIMPRSKLIWLMSDNVFAVITCGREELS